MKKTFLKILILSIFFVILMANLVFAIPGKVNDSNVRVRSGPSTQGTKTLTNLYKNDPVDVISKTGDWYKIKTEDGIVGYMYAQYIDVSGTVPGEEKPAPKPTPKPAPKPVVKEEPKEKPAEETSEYKTEKLTVDIVGKYMPLMYSNNKITFKKGETVNIIDEKGNWTKISNSKQNAWILNSNLESKDSIE